MVFAERAKALCARMSQQGEPPALQWFVPGPSARDRSMWENLPETLRQRYVARAAQYAGQSWPQLLASDWARFLQDGNRAAYESKYGALRRRLADETVAWCLNPDADALFADLIDGLMLICEQTAWQLPAHNNYVRDSPQLPWPDVQRPVLDLFACETGAQLASILYVCGDRLPQAVRAIVRQRLRERIVQPYLNDHFWWMGNGDEPMCNWTAWCTQNVLATVLVPDAAECDDRTRLAVIGKACDSLDCFVKDYGDDGGCVEGAGYWHEAALCLGGCLTMLGDVAPQVFEPLWHDPKIVNMCTYAMKMLARGGWCFNFSDCASRLGRMGVREFRYARGVGDQTMTAYAALDWLRSLEEPDATGITARTNVMYQLWEAREASAMNQIAMSGQQGQSSALDCAVTGSLPETWFPSTGVAVLRDDLFDVAVKAGCNGASHSHNDTGNVIVIRDGRPVLIDLGVGTYTRKTFSPERYDIWTMQSSWHNLPDFDGVMQEATAECRAEDVRVTGIEDGGSAGRDGSGADCDSAGSAIGEVTADLTHAWPQTVRLRRYTRSVRLDRNTHELVIRDDVQGHYHQARMHWIVAYQPELLRQEREQEPGALAIGDARVSLYADGAPAAWTVETVTLDDAQLKRNWGEHVWRITVDFCESCELRIR